MIDKTIHSIQSDILKTLLVKRNLKFSELNKFKMETDHFNYHIKQLIKNDVIRKTKDGTYTLTKKGKILANRIDEEHRVLNKSHMIVVIIGCVREKEGKTQYLFQKRQKEPFFGLYDFVSGRVNWGDNLLKSVEKILKSKTGLSADLSIVGIQHKLDKDENGNLLEDKYMFILRGDDVVGDIKDGDTCFWLTEKELLKKEPTFKNIPLFLEMIKSRGFSFDESRYRDMGMTY